MVPLVPELALQCQRIPKELSSKILESHPFSPEISWPTPTSEIRTQIPIFYQFFSKFSSLVCYVDYIDLPPKLQCDGFCKISCQSRKWQEVRMRCHLLNFDMNYGAFTVMYRVCKTVFIISNLWIALLNILVLKLDESIQFCFQSIENLRKSEYQFCELMNLFLFWLDLFQYFSRSSQRNLLNWRILSHEKCYFEYLQVENTNLNAMWTKMCDFYWCFCEFHNENCKIHWKEAS